MKNKNQYEIRKFFDDSDIDEESEKKKSLILNIVFSVIILSFWIKACTEKTEFNINEIKTDNFWVRVKSSQYSISLRETEIRGETFSCKDTFFTTNVYREFSPLKENDTLIKRGGDIQYQLKSSDFVETKTYYLLEGKWIYDMKKIKR